ncbi:MAG: metallophosphoesterase [Candidatus Aminicenantaceae bacterium]
MVKKKYLLIVALFFFLFSIPISAESDIPCEWTGIKKIVAVGDIHGDFDNFVIILKNIGLINEKLQWTGNQTHLVQTGDIMDRGPDAKKAFDLIKRLEKEAKQAGGMVHMLIGNHEEMNITGLALRQIDYITPEQFVSFLPSEYKEEQEKIFLEELKYHSNDPKKSDPALHKLLLKQWKKVLRQDRKAQSLYLDTFYKNYGQWIINKNTVIKINDIIFVHGGISSEFSKWKPQDINQRTRKELLELRKAVEQSTSPSIELKIVYQDKGPIWYRGLALNDENDFTDDVDRILANLQAKYIVMAHTVQKGNINHRFQKKVWIIDTGISDYYGGHLEALMIENGQFTIWGENNEN